MELRHLRYFLAIAEHSNFRAAANVLLVSQPTLSQQMKDLEKELCTPLFERVGRGVRLTQAGRLFADYAHRSLNVLEEAKSAINEFGSLLRGHLRVGVIQTVGACLVPQATVQFTTEYPGIDLQVFELSASEIESGLTDGGIDLGISFQPQGRRDIESEALFEEHLVLFVSKNHPLNGRRKIRCADISKHRLCLLGREFNTRRLVDAAFTQANASPDVAVEMNSVAACIGITQAGGPATILPELAGMLGDSVAIRIEQPTIKRTVCLLNAKCQSPIRAQVKFADAVREVVRQGRYRND